MARLAGAAHLAEARVDRRGIVAGSRRIEGLGGNLEVVQLRGKIGLILRQPDFGLGTCLAHIRPGAFRKPAGRLAREVRDLRGRGAYRRDVRRTATELAAE